MKSKQEIYLATEVNYAGVRIVEREQYTITGIHFLQSYRLFKVTLWVIDRADMISDFKESSLSSLISCMLHFNYDTPVINKQTFVKIKLLDRVRSGWNLS